MLSDIPTPSDNPHWPSWFYPPDTDPEDPSAHGRVFDHAEDVPEGWLVHWGLHGSNLAREPAPPVEIPLTRREMQAELTKRDIAFPPQAARAELWRLLQEAEEAEILDGSV
jgi:hypothetical protein